jgi:hypothetical protein
MTRDDLIEIMVRATAEWRWGEALVATVRGHRRRLETYDEEALTAALDAAEQAGWRFVPPDDGR